MSWLAYLLLLFGLSWAGVGLFRWYAIDKGMLDEPNERSSHIAPTARGGGVIFFVGWTFLLLVFYYYGMIEKNVVWFFAPVLCVALLGFWEDHWGVSTFTRFFLQGLSAAASLFLLNEGGTLLQSWLPFLLPLPICFLILLIGIVWMTNLYNFMDGSDGFAATQGLFIFGMAGYFFYDLQIYSFATLSWGLVALLAGFLVWNWPVARIFMGDAGSYFLGFLTAVIALMSYKIYHLPLMLWVILTSLFWFDATMTLFRRMLAREKWYKPHRLHAYQRLIQSGWSHHQVLLSAIVVNAVLSGLTWLAYHDPRLMPFSFGVALAFLMCLYIMIEIAKPMFTQWHEAKS